MHVSGSTPFRSSDWFPRLLLATADAITVTWPHGLNHSVRKGRGRNPLHCIPVKGRSWRGRPKLLGDLNWNNKPERRHVHSFIHSFILYLTMYLFIYIHFYYAFCLSIFQHQQLCELVLSSVIHFGIWSRSLYQMCFWNLFRHVISTRAH